MFECSDWVIDKDLNIEKKKKKKKNQYMPIQNFKEKDYPYRRGNPINFFVSFLKGSLHKKESVYAPWKQKSKQAMHRPPILNHGYQCINVCIYSGPLTNDLLPTTASLQQEPFWFSKELFYCTTLKGGCWLSQYF